MAEDADRMPECEHLRASSQHVECPECGAELIPPCHCPDAFLANGVAVPYCLLHGPGAS